jgi:hypothetical protein
MGLYMLNISVDVPNYIFNAPQPDVAFNLQESIIEIVVEKVLGFENAIPETQDSDSDSKRQIKPSFKIDVFLSLYALSVSHFQDTDRNNNYNHYRIPLLAEPFSDVTSPPPDFS